MAAVALENTSLINDANLQGYWKLESDGSDSSSNNYDLTGYGSPTHTSGIFGNAVDLEASSSQFYHIPDASCPNLEISGSQTWTAWIKAESVGDMRVAFKRSASGGNRGLYLDSSDNSVNFSAVGLSTNSNVDSGVVPGVGEWVFVAGVYDSANSKLKVWVNGAKTEVTASGTMTDADGDFAIGRNGSTNSLFFDGLVDDVAIFDRALTDVEIQNLYHGSENATGGTITTSGGKTIHTFTSNGTFTPPTGTSNTVEILVVGGGGGGGTYLGADRSAGGGGAGGLVYTSSLSLDDSAISVSIGAGGAGSTGSTAVGATGSDTTFGSLITAKGGGGGGANPTNGSNGGSGGGAPHNPTTGFGTETQTGQSGISGSAGFGNNGGQGGDATNNWRSGGGGGANAVGGNAGATTGGNGGAGKAYSISGSSVTYAGGGGGGAAGSTSTAGGTGGAGGGGNGGRTSAGQAGTANTGGGGGGGGNNGVDGGNGGSGIVIISYTTDSWASAFVPQVIMV